MIDIAVFGVGRMGQVHAMNVAKHPQARLRYVVDVVESAAKSVAEKYGAEAASLETVIADPSIKAVIITTPTPSHLPLSKACAEAGKAIFCEKPVDLELARVNECLAAVAKAGVPFMVGFQRRFDPTFRAMKRAVDEGAIGDVETVRITSRDPYPPPREYVAKCGGIWKDMMIHDFDIARWFLGDEVALVFATGSALVDPMFAEENDVDTAIAVLKTKNGRLCHIENSRRAVYGYDQRLEVFGSKGMLQAGNRTAASTELWNGRGITHDKPLPFFPERYVDAYANEIQHFVEAIAGGKQPEVGGEAGKKSLELALAAHESWTTGKPVKV